MEFQVAQSVIDRLIAEAAAAHPNECCGILFGERDRIAAIAPTRNVHPTPETHFEIDPQALVDAHRAMRGGGPEVLGYYHSHPRGTPEPSATDRAGAAGDGRVWAIVARGEVALWRDGKSGFAPLSLAVVDG